MTIFRVGSLAMISAAIAAAVLVSDNARAQQHAGPHWTYNGKDGPDHWGELDKAFSICQAGHHQSPIDIRGAKPGNLPPIQFSYRPSPLHIINNGHTIQINYASGSFISVGGTQYQLTQFHFHHPSEERVNGKGFEMVAHLVHANTEGALAVVAVLLDPGTANSVLTRIWQHLPAKEGPEQMLDDVQIDAAGLLPPDRAYYTFTGSLTTPPCTEDVTWFVLKTPATISKTQADAFGKIYPRDARPLQPLYGREVLVSN